MVLTAIQNGAKHYIIKPFSPEKVLAVVNAVLKPAAGKNRSKPEKPANKPKAALNVFANTINGINQSIDNISSALHELDEHSDTK
ncbi:MAG: hypothetical protein ACM3TR_16205 [Caulobacteraceae bacterium]